MKTLLSRFNGTDSTNVVPLILRIVFAIVMFPHGAQLFAGWFGGYGYTGSMGYFASIGLPGFVGFLIIMLEFFGSILILSGFFTRWLALACLVLVIGMILTVHIHVGFFMNWYGNSKGEGYEYHMLMIGMLVVLLIEGGGKASLDALIFNKK